MQAKPSVRDVIDPRRWSNLQLRTTKRNKDDSPGSNLLAGQASIALGTAALAFAQLRLRRIRKEKGLIKQMFAERTSVRSLREAAERGEALPEVAMVRGWLFARGDPVHTLSSEVPTLARHVGEVEQPKNLYVDLAKSVKSGDAKGLPDDVVEHLEGVDLDAIDAVRTRAAAKDGDAAQEILISETLVTRNGCEATKKTVKNKNGTRVVIKRKPRQARFNVFHERRVADGLHLVGMAGEKADLRLPEFGMTELAASMSPSLFLTAPDAMSEFRELSPYKFINADKPFLHMSKFLHLDRQSDTDDGSFNGAGCALAELGNICPAGWLWDGRGFYDNNLSERSWMSYYPTQVLDFPSFFARLPVAKQENSRHQEATKMGYDEMMRHRDEENCFRFAEIAIPAFSEVVVVAKPEYTPSGKIALGPPDPKKNVSDAQFEFRILKGHTAANLLLHREASTATFVGFAVMAVLTVAFGEEAVRDSLVVAYT